MIYRIAIVLLALTALITGVQSKNYFGMFVGTFSLTCLAVYRRGDDD